VQVIAKDVGEEPTTQAQEGNFLVDRDWWDMEQGVGQQYAYADTLGE